MILKILSPTRTFAHHLSSFGIKSATPDVERWSQRPGPSAFERDRLPNGTKCKKDSSWTKGRLQHLAMHFFHGSPQLPSGKRLHK